jgi:hypothetical protein
MVEKNYDLKEETSFLEIAISWWWLNCAGLVFGYGKQHMLQLGIFFQRNKVQLPCKLLSFKFFMCYFCFYKLGWNWPIHNYQRKRKKIEFVMNLTCKLQIVWCISLPIQKFTKMLCWYLDVHLELNTKTTLSKTTYNVGNICIIHLKSYLSICPSNIKA